MRLFVDFLGVLFMSGLWVLQWLLEVVIVNVIVLAQYLLSLSGSALPVATSDDRSASTPRRRSWYCPSLGVFRSPANHSPAFLRYFLKRAHEDFVKSQIEISDDTLSPQWFGQSRRARQEAVELAWSQSQPRLRQLVDSREEMLWGRYNQLQSHHRRVFDLVQQDNAESNSQVVGPFLWLLGQLKIACASVEEKRREAALLAEAVDELLDSATGGSRLLLSAVGSEGGMVLLDKYSYHATCYVLVSTDSSRESRGFG